MKIDFDEISDVIEEYNALPSDYQGIYHIQKLSDRLAIQAYLLAQTEGEAEQEYERYYYLRKKNIAQYVDENKGSVAQLEREAEAKYDEYFKKEQEYKGTYRKFKALRQQCNKVLDRMQQRISILRNEMYLEQNSPNT